MECMMTITGWLDYNHGENANPRLEFTSVGKLPKSVHFEGREYPIWVGGSKPPRYRISGLPLESQDSRQVSFHITSTRRFVFDSNRAATRSQRRKRERAEAKAAKRKTYGWKEYVGRTSTRAVTPGRGERGIAKNRKAQRKLERWVMKIGIWRLGFAKSLYYVKDVRKDGGLDFEVRLISDDSLVARVDSKSEFKTTKPQDRQIEESWHDNVLVFLVGRTSYLPITPETKRTDNGSIWG
jgi:hypothetical protein